ncbi:serine/arginine-rich splicing factor SR45a-like [Rhododendron vialii]|uniref:serine/arginine-rich splicing factor SR45a-like n=1 Tax=Rhododendron vialii TaxID=182163 RepID=UPI00265D9974|nr:serine/arginine-rich splicing factor SR45a-like [Rhododendron vialii]XP_058224984.1 serine/arginine-rich splicing factor SR45a-like [Rhododendron vialii]
MSYSRQGRSGSPPDSRSPTGDRRSRSLSRSRRNRSRSNDSDAIANPGNNLYVTGLSTRVTTSALEKYFNNEGKVADCHLVTDPRTKESRGFAFVTMETNEDANRCIKYLNRSVLEGRLITVDKAKRKRGRTPTPGRYHGLRERERGGRDQRQSRGYSPRRRNERDRRGRSRSPNDRRFDVSSDSYRKHRERSLSAGGSGHRRA